MFLNRLFGSHRNCTQMLVAKHLRNGKAECPNLTPFLAIHEVLDPEEEAFTLDMGELTDALHETPGGIVTNLTTMHETIETKGAEQCHGDNDVELHIDASATFVGNIPHQNVQKINQENTDGGAYMGKAHIDEQMMEVGLVGMEGGGATQHTHAHHTHGIEYGNGEDGEGQRYQPHTPIDIDTTEGLRLKHIEHEDTHHCAHNEGATIAYKHLTGAPEDIVQEEGDERSGTGAGKHDHGDVAHKAKENAKNGTSHDAVATAIPINAVDKVNGIDETDNSDYRKGNAHP